MVATTRALPMVPDGSFSVRPGASSVGISRTIRDPTDRETSRLALRRGRDPAAGCRPQVTSRAARALAGQRWNGQAWEDQAMPDAPFHADAAPPLPTSP